MAKEQMRHIVLAAIGEARDSDAPAMDLNGLGGNVRPARENAGVSGFDSYAGMHATMVLEEKLGVSFDTDNVFLTPGGTDARQLRQIIDVVEAAVNASVEVVGVGR